MKEALLIRFGGLGDLLVALPSIRLIRGKCPRARLTLACRGEYGSLLRETGVVDEIIPEDSRWLTPLFSEAPEEQIKSSARLRSFEWILDWSHSCQGGLMEKCPASNDAPRKFLFIRADPRESGQLSRYFFKKTAEALGESRSFSIADWTRLPTSRLQRPATLNPMAGADGKKRPAVVHPGSGSESKRWPLQNFLRIIGRLGECGVAGFLVTGEAEGKMAAEIEKAILPPNWIWVRRPSLSSLASLLSDSALYLGNDSGVTHLAAACGADVVALFRRDLVAAWEPLGQVQLHVAASLSEVSAEAVWKTVASRLPNFSAVRQNC